ncbi:hypothetical protein [Natrialba sp. PRR66]|uniref:hypothetical protein n=1 Tax=Natrialba sp. PRR66 TaxID=3098146 RepID=UPI002B1E2A86|nr:hypothetical protein [Natrialba sp. PRR66]
MDDSEVRIDHPERLCDAIIGILDELEAEAVIDEERAAELRSEIYRSVDTTET